MADERVSIGQTDIVNITKHIARYNLALLFCEDKIVVDAACGSGYGSFLLSQVAKYVYGVDISQIAIDEAKYKFQTKNNFFFERDILDIWEEEFKSDVIVSFETIEHVKDTEKLKKIFDKVLVSGGLMIYSVPLNEKEGDNEHHVHTYTVDEARAIFSEYETVHEAFQQGVNFYFKPQNNKDKQYYFCVKKKP